MSNDMILPQPSNLKVMGVRADQLRAVEGDVYNVCGRLRDIHPSLYVVLHPDHAEPWVVMEDCVDGNQRMVSRYKDLDQRILEDVRRMLHVPFEKRFREMCKRIDAENEAAENAWMDSESHDKFVWEFREALRKSNMADIVQDSYRPIGGRFRRGK